MSLVPLVLFPVMGLLSLVALNPFSWLYVGVIGILFAAQFIIPKDIRNITTAALALGIIMLWISLFVSNQELLNDYSDFRKPVAIGGFPIKAFEYPLGALGGNVPPADSWGLFYLNLGFWIIVSVGITMLLRKHLDKKISYKFLAISIAISIYGLGYLLVKFD